MPNPKRRFSKARTRKRRSTWKVVPQQSILCPNCKTPKKSHHVCPNCGQYAGRQVLKVGAEAK